MTPRPVKTVLERLHHVALDAAQWLSRQLWERLGVTHDPRVYACRSCGVDQRRVHEHMTIGHAARLCNGCLYKPEWRASAMGRCLPKNHPGNPS